MIDINYVIAAIPSMKNKIHLSAFGLVIILLVVLNYDGFRVLPSALALATMPIILIATYLSPMMSKMGDIAKVLCLLIIVMFSIVLIVLAFYYDGKKQISERVTYEGGYIFSHLLDSIDYRSHIQFIYHAQIASDQEAEKIIRSLILCPEPKIIAKDEYDLISNIAWKYRNCISARNDNQNNIIHITLLDKYGVFIKNNKCHECKSLNM